MKNFYLCSISLSLLLGCSGIKPSGSAQEQSSNLAAVKDTSPAVHGMVLFGTDVLYASHIPMYHAPHDWQAFFQIKLSHPSVDASAAYAKARKAGPQGLFTLMPKPFVLPKLLDGRISSFKADLYKGNFEQGGRVILSDITVTVEELDYKSQLNEGSASLPSLTYFSLKAGGTSYLVHKISSPENFDHIVQIEWLSSDVQEKNAVRSFQIADSQSSRLEVGQAFKVTPNGTVVEADSESEATFKVVSDFYCTQGPDFFNTCN